MKQACNSVIEKLIYKNFNENKDFNWVSLNFMGVQ